MTTLDIQRRLRALGYNSGPLDGVRGRLTIRAVKAFQADQGFAADGIVGRETLGKLFSEVGEGGLPPSPARGEGHQRRGSRRRCG